MPTPDGARLRIQIGCSVRWFNATAEHALNTACGLAERGHRVRLVVKPESPLHAAARDAGLDTLADFDLTALRPDRVASALFGLRRAVRAFAPHVIDTHRSEDQLLSVLAAGDVPVVRTRSDIRPPRNTPSNRALYRRTRFHVACADFMPARFYAPLGIDSVRIQVIRPGMDVETFARGAPERGEARRRLGLEPEAVWVGVIGRFHAVKGQEPFLEACAALPDPPRILLSGIPVDVDGPGLEARARALGLEGRVTAREPLADVRDGLRALDLLAVPSLGSEAVSRIAMEALALGVPVVASDVNGLPEVVGDPGALAPPGDVSAWTKLLARWTTDAALRENAAREGLERLRRRYSRERAMELTEARFRELAGA